MAQKETAAKLTLPKDLRDLQGHAAPEDVEWLAEWVLRRAARVRAGHEGAAASSLASQTEGAFLALLIGLLEDFEARFPADVESISQLTATDQRLVDLRARLAEVLREERRPRKAGEPRVTKTERAFRRLTVLRSAAGLRFDEHKAEIVRRFEATSSPARDAATLIQRVFGRSTRTQDEAKARLASKVRAPRGATDDAAVLAFVVGRVLSRGPTVVAAVLDAWSRATNGDPGDP